MTERSARRQKPRLVGAAVAFCLGAVIAFALSEVALRVINPNWREYYSGRFMQTDFVPGYGDVFVGKPGFDGYFAQNNGDFRTRIRINDFGLRDPEPAKDANGRVWVIGDSMAFGWGVEFDQTYTKIAERASGRSTYNIASPGTDVCGYQALAARMDPTLHPKAVVVGLILENDIHHYRCERGQGPKQPTAQKEEGASGWPPNFVHIKRYLTGASALYNFITTAVKRVSVLEEVLATVGLVERPHAYRKAFDLPDPSGRAASTAAELAYLRSMFAPDTPFAVLICPARFDVRDDDPKFADLKRTVIAELTARGIETIDVTPVLKQTGFAETHLAHDGHWSPKGHQVVGEEVARWISRVVG